MSEALIAPPAQSARCGVADDEHSSDGRGRAAGGGAEKRGGAEGGGSHSDGGIDGGGITAIAAGTCGGGTKLHCLALVWHPQPALQQQRQ